MAKDDQDSETGSHTCVLLLHYILRRWYTKVKETGEIPSEHYSHDHLNEQKDVPIDREASERWKQTFSQIEKEYEEKGERLIWVIIDGFLLYWHPVSLYSPGIRLQQVSHSAAP